MKISNDVLNELIKDGGASVKKSQSEIKLDEANQKMSLLLERNKYIEDSIARLKDQIAKGKEYKFVINRDSDGLMKEIVAMPLNGSL